MRRRFLLVCIVVVTTCALFTAAGAAATEDVDEDSYVVELSDDGSATVSLVVVYELEDETEAAAFSDLEDDEAALQTLQERYVDRMEDVAATTGAAVDREMTVSAGNVETVTADDRGLVVHSVEWTGLAAVDDERLTLSAPFDTAIDDDRHLVVTGPADHELESATPEPDEDAEGTLTWTAGTDLSDFELVYEAPADHNGDADGLPGPGPLLVALLVLATALAAHQRG